MKSSAAHLILIALTLTLLECALCYSYGRDEDPTVDQRLDHLENEVEILTNEMDRVISVISSENSEEGQGDSAQQAGINVLEVRREEEGEMIRFTVKYDSRDETVETRWIDLVRGHKEFSGINTAVGNGLYETSALFPLPVPGNSSEELSFYEGNIWVLLKSSDEYFALELNLTDHEAVDKNIPTPRLDIEPAGDFVYQEGEQFFLKIRIPRSSTDEDGPLSELGNVHVSSVLLDPETGEVASKYSYHDIFEIEEKKQFQNYQEVTARIKGTENGVSGLINLSSRMRLYDTNGVVIGVDRGIGVILRPSTQEGPFPDGFLGFVEMPLPYGGDDVVCMLGEDCYYSCSAVGSDITDLTVRKIKADGTYQNLEGKVRVRNSPYQEYKEVTFHIDYVPEEPEKIKCVVENANGKLISKETTLVISVPVDIIEEESGIVLINGTEDATNRDFEISCTVTGSPQPDVTFNVYSSYNSEYDQEPDEIIERGDDKYTMIKTVTYDTEHVDRLWFYLDVDCMANRNTSFSYESYYMSYDSNNSK